MKNLKDTLTTIAGVMVAFGGTVYTLGKAGIVLPEWLNTAGVVAATVGASIGLYLTGKNPDGSTKSAAQVEAQNEQKKNYPDIK
jgi:hypothetical protein